MNTSKLDADAMFGAAHITPRRSGLSVSIWSCHCGCVRLSAICRTPVMEIGNFHYSVFITIEQNPVIKVKSGKINESELSKIQQGIDYVSRNYDLFLKHYYDTDYSFDDEDLFNALEERGDYK